jgi:hypothetical protein
MAVTIRVSGLRQAQIKLKKIKNVSEQAKAMDAVLSHALKPVVTDANRQVHRVLEKRTGQLKNPYGQRKIKGRVRRVYGRKVAPLRGKYPFIITFFGRPARHIRSSKRLGMSEVFLSNLPRVETRLRDRLTKLVAKYN